MIFNRPFNPRFFLNYMKDKSHAECWQYFADDRNHVVKEKQSHGTVIGIALRPQFFARKAATGVDLIIYDDGDTHMSFYKDEVWYKEYEVADSTKEPYHPAYKYICPVMFNTPHNPVWLTQQEGLSVSCGQASYINKIVVTKFKNSAMEYVFDTSHAAIGDNSVFAITEGYRYTLSFDADSNPNPTLKINDQITTRASDLIDCFKILTQQFFHTKGYSFNKNYMVVHRLLDKDLDNWLFYKYRKSDNKDVVALLSEQYAALTDEKSFYQLPFNEVQLLSLYHNLRYKKINNFENALPWREAILERLLNSDTKSAVDACFYGHQFPSSIKKLMIKTGVLGVSRRACTAISNAVQTIGIDKTRLFIAEVGDQSQPDYYILRNEHLIEAFAVGLNVNVIKDMQKDALYYKNNRNPFSGLINQDIERLLLHKGRYVYDVMVMFDYLRANVEDFVIPSKNLTKAHDNMSKLYTAYKQTESSFEITAMQTVDTSAQTPIFEYNEYIIRSPMTAYELLTIGNDMRHCIGSYMKEFYYRQLEIVVMTDRSGRYLVCMELRGSNVVQAKLKYDDLACDNEKYLMVIEAYMAERHLIPMTRDLGGNNPEYNFIANQNDTKDKERVAIVQDIKNGQQNGIT